jgi:DNA-binding transcriptional LysR family regulator
MELQQLRYVIDVAETASFTRAPERSFVTQSALSHQVAALEREIGHRLFVRTSRSVRLTEAGEAFLLQARVAVAAARKAREDAAEVAGSVTGTLRLGVIPTVTAVDVPLLLRDFREAHPAARVELRVGNSDTLVAALAQDEIDVALLGLRDGVEPSAGVASRALSRHRLVAVVPLGHRLAGRTRIRLRDLAGESFADFPQRTSGRAQSDAAFTAAGLSRDVAFEADSASLLLDLVGAGLAVSLLAPGVVRGSGAAVVPVAVTDGPTRVEHVAWDAVSPRSAARAFLAIVQAVSPGDDDAGPEENSGPASQGVSTTSRRRRPSPSTS